MIQATHVARLCTSSKFIVSVYWRISIMYVSIQCYMINYCLNTLLPLTKASEKPLIFPNPCSYAPEHLMCYMGFAHLYWRNHLRVFLTETYSISAYYTGKISAVVKSHAHKHQN